MKNGEKTSADSKRPKPYQTPKHYSKTALIKAIQSKRANTLIKDGAIDNKRSMGMAAPAICPSGGGFGSGYAQQALTRVQQSFLGVLGPPTQVVVADTILDGATLNSKYA